MNEGHSALLALGLLERRLDQSFAGRVKQLDIDGIRRMCIFTTHTPVPAGHDQFPKPLVRQLLGDEWMSLLEQTQALHDDALNMTYLALALLRLRERSRHAARRSLARHVPELRHQRHHQRRARAYLDLAGIPRTVRSLHSRLAHRQQLSPLRHQHPARRHSRRARRPPKKPCSRRSGIAPPFRWTRRFSRSASPAAPAPTSAPTCCFRIASA